MYTAVVLEDDAQAASVIEARIADSPYAGELSVTHVASPAALADRLSEAGRPDILFADIRVEDDSEDGIQAVRDLLPWGCGTQVIYITGYVEYCVSVYETHHVYFLLKPVDQATFNKALKRALDNLRSREERMLPVTYKGKTTLVDPVDVLYIESRLRKVIFHEEDEDHEVYSTMSEMAEVLPSSFVRCHKSFLINMDAIQTFDATEVMLRSGQKVPVGQRYRDSLRASMVRYFGMSEADREEVEKSA